MRKLVLGLVGASALAFASAANAQACTGDCSYTVTPGVAPYAGPPPTYTFDVGSRPTTDGGGGFEVGTPPGNLYAQPYGTGAGTGLYGGDGYYYSVGPSTSYPGIIDLTSYGDINSLSFIWGSVDSYNTLYILDSSMNVLYKIVGNNIFDPANGDRTSPNTNPLVTFNFTGDAVGNVSYLELNSTVNAFEMDNLAINPVPEPATWALMLLGFGGIGMALRRRRKPALAQLA
jgi:hypothetical protein